MKLIVLYTYRYIYILYTPIYIYMQRTLELLGTNRDQTSCRCTRVCTCRTRARACVYARHPAVPSTYRPLEVYVRSRALQVAHDGCTGETNESLCESCVNLTCSLPPLLFAATKAILREERSEEVEHGSTVAPRVVRRSIFTGQRFVRTVRVLLVIVRLFLLLLLRLPFFSSLPSFETFDDYFSSRGIIRFLKNNSSSDH